MRNWTKSKLTTIMASAAVTSGAVCSFVGCSSSKPPPTPETELHQSSAPLDVKQDRAKSQVSIDTTPIQTPSRDSDTFSDASDVSEKNRSRHHAAIREIKSPRPRQRSVATETETEPQTAYVFNERITEPAPVPQLSPAVIPPASTSTISTSSTTSVPSSSSSVPAPTATPTPVPGLENQKKTNDESGQVTAFFQRVWFWLGIGMNYTHYSQTVPGLADVNFGNIKGPSLSGRAGSMINERWGVDLGYKETPGEVQSSSAINVQSGNYNWRTLSAEGLYSLTGPFEETRSMAFRLGLQQHQIPFMAPIAANTIEVRDHGLTMATAGIEYVLYPKNRLRWEFLARYQYPIGTSASTGNTYTVSPKFAVDGSLGQVFRINDRWSIGAYWYGQWHSYSFNYKDNGTGISFDGSETLFFSNIDVRIGFEF